MHEIDFLPAEYLQSHARRQSQPWRVFVVLIFAALIAVAAFGQHRRRSRLEAELAAIAPQREAAAAKNVLLESLQSQLLLARAEADLFTYLRHPWPRTRILHALLAPLPERITFEQLEIQLDTPHSRGYLQQLSPSQQEERQTRLAGQPPAARDLQRLRDEVDRRQTVVTITGLTTESAAVHGYLGELGRVPLFSKVELASIETDQANPDDTLRFRATLVLRPGHGQLDGSADPTAGSPPVAHDAST